jgi:hypothetical protein
VLVQDSSRYPPWFQNPPSIREFIPLLHPPAAQVVAAAVVAVAAAVATAAAEAVEAVVEVVAAKAVAEPQVDLFLSVVRLGVRRTLGSVVPGPYHSSCTSKSR